MKMMIKRPAAILAGAIFGFSASFAAADESSVSTPAYLLANLYVKDFETYSSDYANHLGPLLAEAGAEVLVVAPAVTKLEGDNGANLTIVVRFPSMDAAEMYFGSENYSALRPARIATTDADVSTLVLAPGFNPESD